MIELFRLHLYSHKIQNEIRMFVLKNFAEISIKSVELMQLSFDEFRDIIADEMLNVKNEEIAWNCCLSWIEFDEENRVEFVVPLMKCVRLGLLSFMVWHVNLLN